MKSVAYVGNFAPPYSTENDVAKAFEYIGWNVKKIQENGTTTSQIRELALDSDLLLITGTWGRDAIELDDWLGLIHELAVNKIPSATLHLDTFWGTGRGGRKWWLEPMFHTSYLFTADGDYQKQWELLGKKHYWLKPAVRHDAAFIGKFNPEYACDVAFVGSNGVGYHEDVYPERRHLVNALREMCQRNKWVWRNPGGDEPKIERDNSMNDFYASAKVTVGDSLCLKKEVSHYCSDRVYEATGRGGFLIMPKLNFLDIDFDGNLPMFSWDDYTELENLIRYWLYNDDKRIKTQKACQQYTAKNHTYVNRIKEMLGVIGL